MIRFYILNFQDEEPFNLIYRTDLQSFDIEPNVSWESTPLLVNDLQLAMNLEDEILYVHGICPLDFAEMTEEYPQKYPSFGLAVIQSTSGNRDLPRRLNDEDWPIHINKKKGWACIGDPEICNKELIEFAPNCVASLVNRELKGLWLKPRELPDS